MIEKMLGKLRHTAVVTDDNFVGVHEMLDNVEPHVVRVGGELTILEAAEKSRCLLVDNGPMLDIDLNTGITELA